MANLPFSPIRRAGDIVFVSGQIGLKNGKLVSDDLRGQVKQAVENICALLGGEGLSLSDVFDVAAFLTNPADYEEFNETYLELFSEPYPARTTVFVSGLPMGAKVELKVISRIPD